MEWTAVVSAIVGGALAIGGGAFQHRLTAKRADSEWVRNRRFNACVRVASGYEKFTNAIFWDSSEWDPHVHGPPPEQPPDPGESELELRDAVTELQLVGPPSLAEAAHDLLLAVYHYRSSVYEGVDDYYLYWGHHHQLKHRFLVEASAATGMNVAPPGPLDWQSWRERFKALDED